MSWPSGAYGIYTLGVPYEWPERLLHIPSMTSRVWKLGNFYGDDKEPEYAIISYTWGRYEIPEGPHLEIKGIDWKVPSIRPDHFTVEDFTSLMQQIGLVDEYIWIDIACIDQKREKIKMKEVGRQAIIFRRAKRAYIWLNKHEPTVIQDHLQRLMQCAYDHTLGKMDPLEAAQSMIDSLTLILHDPWFSSLWTLQESYLQRNSTLLNKRGQHITTAGPWTGEHPICQLMDVSGACSVARSAINQAIEMEKTRQQDSDLSLQTKKLQDLRAIIDKSGLDFTLCPNPNIQYAAARFRQTTRQEDRIYAIMQAYGYRLGNSSTSIRRLKKFGLEELELQFLQTLNVQSIILGQAFQHLAEPAPGQSWCITNHICVPARLQMIIVHDIFVSSHCTITIRSKNEAYFQNFACTIADLSNFWHSRSRAQLAALEKKSVSLSGLVERNAHIAGPYRNFFFTQAKQGLIMDFSNHHDAAALSHEWPPDTTVFDDSTRAIIENRVTELTDAAERQQAVLASLTRIYGNENIRVLYLGCTKHIETMDFALLLVRAGESRRHFMAEKIPVWRRIGIAFWNIEGDCGYGSDLIGALKPLAGRFG